jgi:DNA-binding winged helix-turn-helix (wHTH) protein/TolB-like protein
MRYRFGLFEYDDSSGQLSRQGQAVALEGQPRKALELLLRRAGETVSKEEMRSAIWGPDHHVDVDKGLGYCLSQIRAALDDSGSNPRFVETQPRKGYRFIAPVETPKALDRRLVAAGMLVLGALGIWAFRGKVIRIGVSVFDNETGDSQFDRWVGGLSDLVLEQLARVSPSRLGLIGNEAPLRRPRNIRDLRLLSSEIQVDYVVLGQLQKDEEGLRFITHLVRMSDGVHLKANRLRGKAEDLRAFEAVIRAEYEAAVRKHVLHAA